VTPDWNEAKCNFECDPSKHPNINVYKAGTPLEVPGYGVATSDKFNFNSAGGWAGWSVPTGKVAFGAIIISTGHKITDFAVFKPASPTEVFPHYTFGANEYGWVLQAKTGNALSNVQIEVYYADQNILTTSSIPGYTVVSTPVYSFSSGGWADVRCPVNKLPLGARIVRNEKEKRAGGYTVYEDFAIFAPAWKNEVFPSGKLCDNKHGWVMSVKESINYNRDGMVVEVICVNQ
jgi:hypothetical protein